MHKTELIHILISVVTISLAFSINPFGKTFISLGTFSVVLLTVGAGFILHELAHKLIAQKYGCIAGYKMWVEGLVLALFMAVFTGFVFAAPGAVYIYKQGLTRKEDGHISIAGPATNILLATLFALLIPSGNSFAAAVGVVGFQVNSFLALFNLLPIPPLDGSKVFRWNKTAWAAIIALSAVMVFAWQYYLAALYTIL